MFPASTTRADKMAATGLYDDGRRDVRRVSDPHLRIRDMERDGVDAEVIYGILGAAPRGSATTRRPTRCSASTTTGSPISAGTTRTGTSALACLPYGDVDAAVSELRRVAKMGIRGVELSCSWDMEPMWHPCWEPLWQAVHEVDLPCTSIPFPPSTPTLLQNAPPGARRPAFFTVVSSFQMNLANLLAAIIGAGVLERHPNVRVAFGESGIGWIPYALDRMDFEWEDRFRDLGLAMKPSDYWRRQCRATFQYDRIGAGLVEEMGVESLMWGSDYPHGDGVWPESDRYLEEQFAHLPADTVHRITCANAHEFYRLPGEAVASPPPGMREAAD